MMEGLRKAGQSWLGRIVVTIMFGFLILSFAIWGIGDMLRQTGRQVVAKVGSTEISAVAFRDAYQTELQSLSRRARRPITNEEARAYGLDRQVLNRMITEAVMDQRAHDYGLAISDDDIAKAIFSDPNFKGANGQFDRNRFNELLRDNGFTEQGFVRTQRNVYLRQQLASTVAGDLPVPGGLRDAVHRYQSESRGIRYFVLGADRAGEVAPPDDAKLQAFFDQRKEAFRAPEYRNVVIVTLGAADLAKPESVSEADAKAFYERNKGRWGEPERRTVKQIVFPSPEEAQAAAERIKAGTSFEAIAEERKLAAADVELGDVTRSAIVDPAVADAAFGLKEPGVSDPVKGQFGTVIVKVDAIKPEAVKPFAEVQDAIRKEIAAARAKNDLQDVHDKIEDQRASAKSLADIARDLKLPLRTVDGVARSGQDRSGKPVDLPDRDALLKAVFASDIGVDNEPVATKEGGWIWFDVTKIDPARDRKLDEVRPEVEAAWKAEAVADKVADKAAEILKSLKAGTTLEAAAAGIGAEVKTAAGIKRQGAAEGLSQATVAQVFATPVGQYASAIGATPQERVLLQVTGAEVPQLLSTTQEASRLDDQIRTSLSDDILSAYVARLQSDMGVTINEAMVRQAVGGGL